LRTCPFDMLHVRYMLLHTVSGRDTCNTHTFNRTYLEQGCVWTVFAIIAGDMRNGRGPRETNRRAYIGRLRNFSFRRGGFASGKSCARRFNAGDGRYDTIDRPDLTRETDEKLYRNNALRLWWPANRRQTFSSSMRLESGRTRPKSVVYSGPSLFPGRGEPS